MTESLQIRFDFPSPVVQAQTVRHLVAAVLKEIGVNGKITQSSTQGPALEALWQQCCSDCALVRSACCDALVLLVDQGHADLHYVLNSVLNLLPSARNVQGLMKVIRRLLQMQADRRDRDALFTCPYSIRSSPHPFITVLENRVDCWPTLLLEIDDFIGQAADRSELAYVTMLAPFLQYLYCEPQRLPQHALLRHRLLRVLVPVQPGAGSVLQNQDQEHTSLVSDSLLRCLCQLVPHMQADSVEAVLELCGFADALLQGLVPAPEERWRTERVGLLLQLLCACQHCLELNGDCRPLLGVLQRLLPAGQQALPLDELLMGVAMFLLEVPAAQQTSLLRLALSLVPEETELSPWLSPVLVLPVLQLLSCSDLTEPLADRRTHSLNQDLAHRLLRRISRETDQPRQSGPPLALPLTSWYSELSVALSTLRKVAGDPAAAADWLLSVSAALSSSQSRLCSLALIVSHLIIAGREDVCQLALKASQDLATADPCQVPSLIPVLLFKLGKEKNPVLAHAVLNCLPNLGTHKLCVPMVLQTLHMLASAPKLRAVAMRLMTALWRKQDRIYPELQRLLGQEDSRGLVGRDAQWEQILARAACLRDICRERPYQHGSDMLAVITLTLNQCTRPDMATPAALALQGLRELCQAEVVDIVSTWRSLGPELSCDSRPLMVKVIAELLALVPQLTVKSDEYEKLKEEVVSFLWNYAVSRDPEVASCGYRALADFPETVHTINLLPEAARPAPKAPEHEEDEPVKEEEEEKDLSIPGPSYVKLMALTPVSVLPAFELFLTSLVKQEMSQMPRGVYFSALRGGNLRSDQGKTMAGIPSFMLKTYEKNKQPGLKPGLAAGLLLCYELPVQTDRDGRRIDRFLVSRSRSYQQTLAALIHEVNIQPSEWHRALLLPQAWRGFMSRAFHGVLQGRRAELEIQQKQGKEEPQDLQYKQHCAWLWARDQLADVIKAATKDSPVVQGNSILALSGLAAALAKYESNLPADGDGGLRAGPEFVPTASWLAMVVNTLLSISSSSYKARGQVFPWFLHRSYSGENTASAIARSCASLALSLLVPVLVVWQRDGLGQVLSVLQAGLPASPTADDSQAVQFHSGLALGMVLSSLHHQRLGDVSVQKDTDLLHSSLEALESCSFNPNLEYNTGCVLGLGLVLAALCSSGQMDQHVHVTLTLDKLLSSLQDSSGQGRILQEALAYSVACVGVSAFSGGLIDADKAEEVMNTLRTLTEESQQTPGFSLALGLTVHGLSMSGHGKAEDIHPRLLAAWIKILLAEGCPTMQRLAAVNGLVALVGSETSLIQQTSESELSSQQQSRLNEVIRAITQIITFSGAIGLQSNSACLVGHLHLAHVSTSHSHTAVPQDFSYLSEKSVIRAIVDFITEAGKKGPEFAHPAVVKSALTPLAAFGASFQYPPVNWSAVLSPLMRLSFGEDVQHQCVLLAACQAQSSHSASLFLGPWLSPPLVHSLSYQTRAHLLDSLGLWMKHIAEDKLQVHMESLGLQQFQEDLRPQRLALCRSLLQGLARAMALPNPPNNCWTILCSTTEKIFTLLPNQIQDNEVDLYVGIAKCLSEMSDAEIDRITRVTELMYLREICNILSIPGTVPKRFVQHRWLSAYDVAISTQRLLPAYKVLYYGFMDKEDKALYKDPLKQLFADHSISERAQAEIRSFHEDLSKKGMTQLGKERKRRVVQKVWHEATTTELHLSVYTGVLPILNQYVMVFQGSQTLVHKLHDKQLQVFTNFLACFVESEHLNSMPKALSTLDFDHKLLPLREMYVGREADRFRMAYPQHPAQMEKTCFVLAYLTSQGRVPLLGLNDVIAGVLRGWSSRRVGWLLLQTFYQCRLAASPSTDGLLSVTAVSKRMEWLLELMGHIRNVAYGATSVTCGDTKLATDFLFQVFAAAVVSWGDHSMPLLLGIRAQWFPWQPDSKPKILQHSLYGEESLTDLALPQCLLGMPRSLALLLDKEPWSGQTHKFIDWLFSITEAPQQSLSATTVSTAKAGLLALKSSAEFKKKAVWTRAYGW